jgi:uncharacterized membrane protein
MRSRQFWPLLVLALWLARSESAAAYIGPGAGISVIGTAVAFIGSLIFALIGFVWYPIKRLVAAMKNAGVRRPEEENADESVSS